MKYLIFVFALFLVYSEAVITFPHVISAIEIQVGEMRQKVLQLEEDERQLQTALDAKIKETNQLNAVNPQLTNIINKLKEVIVMNHKEKEKILTEARSLLAGIPEIEQSQIIRKLHMERWIQVYTYLVPHMKKEIPINRDDNRFNVTLRIALTSGDTYNPTIEKYKKSADFSKTMIEIYQKMINEQLIQWNNAITVYSTEGKCPLDIQAFISLYKNLIEKLQKSALSEAQNVVKQTRYMKVEMKKRYTIIAKNLKKMLPNKLFEDEELDVVRNLLNETVTTIKTIDEEMKDNSIVDQVNEKVPLIKADIQKASTASGELYHSYACKTYRERLSNPLPKIQKDFKKLAYLEFVAKKNKL
ncbi:hypothetical protein ENUP19_0180G0005 [Entamoeba nuttalli]|uniref:Uncharacterized protein n=2 Tax=Entamoeba nuttalli TaxID=412467 RepID=K2HWT6_ENTNP|nr:hypothetical protein ENU1_081430 [Entamoeba nuttalli P19]EKE40720.1 hypothetical protein ENU1_081430 [Entamoeba nuttalli P19]|eukprot:XP_008856947.1 hypothetical protein ENU1_081430 [Entamoeba nuttalli P19]